MFRIHKKVWMLAFGSLMVTASAGLVADEALAAVTAQEASALGKDLTVFGAQKAGNAAGTIPAYTGGLTQAPASFKKKGGFLTDPFASEKPLFSITAANVEQYRANLSEGQVALLKKYPDYKMNVYTTHRSTAYPAGVAAAIEKNATTAKTVGDGVEGFEKAVPFPIPKTGLEVIWNHLARYRGAALRRDFVQVPVERDGSYVLSQIEDSLVFPRNLPDFYNPAEDQNINFYFYQIIKSPASLAGNVLMVHETLDQIKEPRRAWQYNAGQRRVRRAPQVAYDSPGSASDGLRTIDNYDMFNGAPDRYEWKLVGKQELYIPYNSYRLAAPENTYKSIHQAGHMNPELLRYELHRVWKVEATLKTGARHIYAKRVFYVDEDSWQAAVIDHHDAQGKLWRVAEAYALQYYDATVPFYTGEALYDLQAGRYLTIGLVNESGYPYDFTFKPDRSSFTPAGLRRLGVQ